MRFWSLYDDFKKSLIKLPFSKIFVHMEKYKMYQVLFSIIGKILKDRNYFKNLHTDLKKRI